jgi:hypothetical protein
MTELSAPLPTPSAPGESRPAGTGLSTGFLAFVGAVAGGMPQLFVPTATLIEFIGNTVMGAIIVAAMDALLLRQTLAADNLRRGRILLIVTISVTLTLVTYKQASFVFQTIFDTAPTENIQRLSARAFTHDRIGNVGYHLTFTAKPTDIQKLEERMATLVNRPGFEFEQFQPGGTEDFTAFARRITKLPDLNFPAEVPQGMLWRTVGPTGRTSTTVLLRDASTGQTFVRHTSG